MNTTDPIWTALAFREYPLVLRTELASFARPSVHMHMLADTNRMHALERAIARVVEPGATVVDVGAGTGILSHMALAAGASHVFAIEAGPASSVVEKMLQDNGISDRVTLLKASSFDVELPEPVDVVISETLGHIGIDEGILDILADARRRFCKSTAQIVPARLQILATPVHCPLFHRQFVGYWREAVAGYQVRAMEPWVIGMTYLTVASLFERLAGEEVIMDFDCHLTHPPPHRGTVEFSKMLAPSRLSGFALSFVATLAPGVRLHAVECRHWGPVFLPLPAPVPIARGAPVALELVLGEKEAVTRCRVVVGGKEEIELVVLGDETGGRPGSPTPCSGS